MREREREREREGEKVPVYPEGRLIFLSLVGAAANNDSFRFFF